MHHNSKQRNDEELYPIELLFKEDYSGQEFKKLVGQLQQAKLKIQKEMLSGKGGRTAHESNLAAADGLESAISVAEKIWNRFHK